MLSKVPDVLTLHPRNHPIHIRRRFEHASQIRVHQWLAEAIGVFSLLALDDAQHLAKAGAQIAQSALQSGRSISIDLLLDGNDVEIQLGVEGSSGSQAILRHHATETVSPRIH